MKNKFPPFNIPVSRTNNIHNLSCTKFNPFRKIKHLAVLALAILFFQNFAQAEKRSFKALKTSFEKNTFTATLQNGFHFNEKAPNGVQIDSKLVAPDKFERQQLKISSLPTSLENAVARIYVCDDAITFCEDYSIQLQAKSNAGQSNNDIEAKELLGKGLKKTSSAQLQSSKKSHGFILNDFGAALKAAQEQKKNIFVDFGTRWCPACLRLENEIFSNRQFQLKAKSFVLVKIDGDVFANSPILEKYKVRGYPSLLFLNSKGEELFRFYDYQPLAKVLSIFNEVQSLPFTTAELEMMNKTEAVTTTLWKRYYFTEQYEKSLAIMNSLKTKPDEYLNAKVQSALVHFSETEKAGQEGSVKSAKLNAIQVIHDAIASDNYSLSTRGLQWRQSLIELLPSGEAEIQTRAIESATIADNLLFNSKALQRAIKTDSLGEFGGFERFYVAFLNAEIATSANYEETKAWSRVVDEGYRAKITNKNPGIALRWLSAMMQAKQFEKANQLAKSLLKADPSNGDLQRRHLRILVELQKYSDAVQVGRLALKNSYGSNEFFVVEPLAKALFGANARQEGEDLIRKYLEKNEVNFAQVAGYKKKLEALLAESQKLGTNKQ